jgi:hypothetical protein
LPDQLCQQDEGRSQGHPGQVNKIMEVKKLVVLKTVVQPIKTEAK